MFKKELTVELVLKAAKQEFPQNVTEVDLSNKSFKSIENIQCFLTLTKLDLSNCKLNDELTKPISRLRFLTSLELSLNDIKDISFVSSLRKLAFLNLSKNQVEQLHPLLSLYYLRELDLRCNRISDFGQIKLLARINLYKLLLLFNSPQDNPIVSDQNYRVRVLYIVPYLRVLDFQDVDVNDYISCFMIYRDNKINENSEVLSENESIRMLIEQKRAQERQLKEQIAKLREQIKEKIIECQGK